MQLVFCLPALQRDAQCAGSYYSSCLYKTGCLFRRVGWLGQGGRGDRPAAYACWVAELVSRHRYEGLAVGRMIGWWLESWARSLAEAYWALGLKSLVVVHLVVEMKSLAVVCLEVEMESRAVVRFGEREKNRKMSHPKPVRRAGLAGSRMLHKKN